MRRFYLDKIQRKQQYQDNESLRESEMTVLFRSALQIQKHFSWCEHRRLLSMDEHVCQWCRFDMYALVFLAAFLMAAVEFWASARTHSLSLWSDAWHVVSDGLGYSIAGLYAFVVSRQLAVPENRNRMKRYSEYALGMLLLVAVSNIIANIIGFVWLGTVPVIHEPRTLLWVAVMGLGVNLCQLGLLNYFKAEHQHEHHAEYSGEKMLAANFWHTVGDMMSSVLVVLNAVMVIATKDRTWAYFDLVASAVIAGILFWQTIQLFASEKSSH